MTITFKIDTGNAAFANNRYTEVTSIIGRWLDQQTVATPRGAALLYDANGNKVGVVTVKGK